ncbi:MAG: AMP-binding protein [Deltaproteobacteria bacterium]|uniref:acyl-CoA synthetase n=1 Tax=Desulfobacula sp. TaxID=2593537 RepID=UPI0019841591|nr:AMP-binding protein [Candidatus Desulfobacula maris]MBL6996035.1 AMP-binding protein [Desulfobacula sp.]
MFTGETYEEVYNNFCWDIPKEYNIGVDICDKWAGDKFRLALIYIDENQREHKYTYWELMIQSNRLANGLKSINLQKGDRVAVLLPSCPETLFTHLAVYKSGAILLPLLELFGSLAVKYRLQSSGAKIIVTDQDNLHKVLEVKSELPDLEKIIVVKPGDQQDVIDFYEILNKGNRQFTPVQTLAEDPAIIIYTSGTTGQPKGALHAHRLLLAEVVNFSFSLNFFPQEGDLLWTHCDWGYIAGSFAALYPCLHFGMTIVENRRTGRFDPHEALRIISKYGVSVIFAIATAIRIIRKEVPFPKDHYNLDELRSITIGGETMGDNLYEWGKSALGVEFNENYGMTECDFTISNCSAIMEVFPGSMGRAIPGHTVGIINPDGEEVASGEYGEIAIQRPDPSLFLEYWQNQEATQKKYNGDWFLTGDFGYKDKSGYFWFVGREDDVIETGGFRVGPGEIEDAVMKHEAVEMAAAIGIPHEIKGEVVKAYIILRKNVLISPALEQSIKDHVRNKLEAWAYPKEIEFVTELPIGNTGKVLKKELKALDAKTRRKK